MKLKDEKIMEFVEQVNAEKSKYKLSDGDYCIIIYAGSSLRGARWVKYIYKNINDFSAKILKDIKNIDPMYSIDFQMWIFD